MDATDFVSTPLLSSHVAEDGLQGCSVLLESCGFEEGVDVDGGAPSGVSDVIAAIGA